MTTSLPCYIRHHTLEWVLARRAAFEFLLLDMEYEHGNKELTSSEWEMLVDIVNPASAAHSKFWAYCLVIQCLSDWGVAISKWMHQCRCCHHVTKKERDTCHMKGRCGIEMAMGTWKEFLSTLANLKLSPQAAEMLSRLDDETSQKLLRSFQDCKHEMEFRGKQAWSFWDCLPHKLLSMGHHFLTASLHDEQKSRKRAVCLLEEYDSCTDKPSLGVVSWYVFSRHRNDLLHWCVEEKPMSSNLRSILFGYCSSLLVMQRLEGRHHLVNIRLTKGRALLPAGLMADLRRKQHPDLRMVEFRNMFPELLRNLSELVPDSSWQSRRELLKRVYGFGLEDLHPDVSAEQALMDKTTAASKSQSDATPSRIVA